MDKNSFNKSLEPSYMGLHAGTGILTGIIMGLISGIPFINMLNCCFIVYLGGGILSVFLFSRKSDILKLSDSLILGIIAGFTCGLLSSIIDLILHALGFNQSVYYMEMMLSFFERMELPAETAIQLNEQFLEALEQAKNLTIADMIKGAFYAIIFSIIFTVIGSLIGGLLFKKEAEGPSEETDNSIN